MIKITARLLLVSAWLTFSIGFAAAQAAHKTVHVPDRLPDAYAIYSLLMPGKVFSSLGASKNQQWAIADTTVGAQDISPALAPDAALQAPAQHPERFSEALADYHLRKNGHLHLTRRFALDRPYVLLTPAEVADFRASRISPNASLSLQQEYAVYPGITYFSEVYFNSKMTAALVYMLNWCGNLCAQSEWVYLEKQNDHWVRRSG